MTNRKRRTPEGEEPSDLDRICAVLDKYNLEDFPIEEDSPASSRYEPEALALLMRVSATSHSYVTAQNVRDVWLVFFGTVRKRLYGPIHDEMSGRSWIEVGSMPMRSEFQKIADEINALFGRVAPSKSRIDQLIAGLTSMRDRIYSMSFYNSDETACFTLVDTLSDEEIGRLGELGFDASNTGVGAFARGEIAFSGRRS